MATYVDQYAADMQSVRAAVRQRISRLPGMGDKAVLESFLFRRNYFCGVRFSCGSFRAEWMFDEPAIRFFHDANEIDRVVWDPNQSRAAA